MQTTEKKVGRTGSQRAFTLIELMVVVAIIGILIGGIFQLLNTAGQMNQKAETTSRLQRLQNALSGFYAEYGTYPPVPQYQSPDPWASGITDDFGRPVTDIGSEDGFASACSLAAQSQPMAFEYPNVKGLDAYVNQAYQQWGVLSPNTLLAPIAASYPKDDWGNIKLFKFGVMSFLLPRLEQVGFTGDEKNEMLEPDNNFYGSRQWKSHNPVSNISGLRKSLSAQQIVENRAAARWMPNLEKIVMFGHMILGVNTCEPYTDGNTGGYRTLTIRDANNAITDVKAYDLGGNRYVLQFVSVRDGWGREFYYYSAPPYQSYRIWSAGKDGRTFPPWIPISTLTGNERTWAAKWTKDDIVRFDH